jgi:hypothetical protein
MENTNNDEIKITPEQEILTISKSKFQKAFQIGLIYFVFSLIISLGLFLYSFTVPFDSKDYSKDEPWWIEGTLQSNFIYFAILSFSILAAIGQILSCFFFSWLKIKTWFSIFLLIYTLFFVIFSLFYINYIFGEKFGEKLTELFFFLTFLFNPILFLISSIWQLFYFHKKIKTFTVTK